MGRVCETKKEYYDLLVRCAHDGTFPSFRLDEKGGVECLYRGPDGKKCAAGVLVPDDVPIHPGLENENFNNKAVADLFRPFIPEGMTEGGVAEVQYAHDAVAINLGGGWDAEEFVRRLNGLEFFREFAGGGIGEEDQE